MLAVDYSAKTNYFFLDGRKMWKSFPLFFTFSSGKESKFELFWEKRTRFYFFGKNLTKFALLCGKIIKKFPPLTFFPGGTIIFSRICLTPEFVWYGAWQFVLRFPVTNMFSAAFIWLIQLISSLFYSRFELFFKTKCFYFEGEIYKVLRG